MGKHQPTEQQILEAAFAPAQPAAEASRFGSPELQAMIIARCVEKDQAGSVLEDAARWRDWTQAFAEASAAPEDTVFMKAFEDAIGDSDAPFTAEQFTSWVDAARKQGEKQ